MKNRTLLFYGILGLSIIVVDRCSKIVALAWCGTPNDQSSCISCCVAINRGISWGLLHSESTAFFSILSLFIVIITAVFIYYAYKKFCSGNSIIGEICIIAGSCSNIFDRFYYYGVVDFILLSYNTVSFPIFNCADIAIVFGIFIILGQSHWKQEK